MDHLPDLSVTSDLKQIILTAVLRATIHVTALVGSYLITSVQALPGNGIAFFESNGSGPFDDAGFAYLPTPPPAGYDGGLEAGRFRHLRGGWYAFTSSW